MPGNSLDQLAISIGVEQLIRVWRHSRQHHNQSTMKQTQLAQLDGFFGRADIAEHRQSDQLAVCIQHTACAASHHHCVMDGWSLCSASTDRQVTDGCRALTVCTLIYMSWLLFATVGRVHTCRQYHPCTIQRHKFAHSNQICSCVIYTVWYAASNTRHRTQSNPLYNIHLRPGIFNPYANRSLVLLTKINMTFVYSSLTYSCRPLHWWSLENKWDFTTIQVS